MRSRRQVRKNPAPKASKRRKPAESASPPAPPNRIRELRKRARMSLKDLSELTGEPIPTLSRWETKGGVTVEKLAKVVTALRVPIEEAFVKTLPARLTSDQAFLLERFAAATPQTRDVIVRIVGALTET
jgi:transcriptional regulator with XRE-family HTH domain